MKAKNELKHVSFFYERIIHFMRHVSQCMERVRTLSTLLDNKWSYSLFLYEAFSKKYLMDDDLLIMKKSLIQ